jgi:hypothetical protein
MASRTVDNNVSVYSQAVAYLAAGLSIIPVKRDGSKAAAVVWKEFQTRLPTAAELAGWFDRPDPPGIAAICGAVSGALELLDFDAGELFDIWRELVEAECPGLVSRLTVVRTPREPLGLHVWYRCPDLDIPGNEKLAEETVLNPQTGKSSKRALIETRGEGGIGLLPGCPPPCHPSGRTYEQQSGPPVGGAVVSVAEWDVLRRCARSLHRLPTPEAHEGNGRQAGGRPGDDFNKRATWEEVLGPHGWTVARQSGTACHWRRPGKEDPGGSATTGFCKGKDGTDRLYVFSSKAHPFEDRHCYSKFAAYALLNHAGDYKAAAKELAQRGYGEPPADEPGGKKGGKPSGYAIILQHFRDKYDPTFRDGTSLFSRTLGRPVKMAEACCAPGHDLAKKLEGAWDAPRSDNGVSRNKIPRFFADWSKSAWIDLLDGLPVEEEGEEIDEAVAEKFRAKVAAALFTIVTLGSRHVKKGRDGNQEEETDVMRRSLLSWCCLWAITDSWGSIRSYQLWTKRAKDDRPEERSRADKDKDADGLDTRGLRIALRVELFGQLPGRAGDLAGMSQNKFGRLCEMYDVGTTAGGKAKAQGKRVVLLNPEFIESLLTRAEDFVAVADLPG